MKIAYLVLAHDNPNHLVRLTRALSTGDSSIFIHIDRKSNLAAFSGAHGENVQFTRERIPVHWGDFSQVEAILTLMETALSAAERHDYYVLVSGTDYPLRSASYINSFFERNAGQEFINIAPMGSEPIGKALSRLSIFRARPSDPLAVRVAAKLARIIKVPLKRDYECTFGDLTPYGGCTWWALSRQACEHVQSFLSKKPDVVEFFKHTRCPDEMFFQTVLGNSHFRSKARRNVTYADWSAHGSSPANLCERHLDFFRSDWPLLLDDDYGRGEALFARKFSDLRPDIAAGVDQIVREREHNHTPSMAHIDALAAMQPTL